MDPYELFTPRELKRIYITNAIKFDPMDYSFKPSVITQHIPPTYCNRYINNGMLEEMLTCLMKHFKTDSGELKSIKIRFPLESYTDATKVPNEELTAVHIDNIYIDTNALMSYTVNDAELFKKSEVMNAFVRLFIGLSSSKCIISELKWLETEEPYASYTYEELHYQKFIDKILESHIFKIPVIPSGTDLLNMFVGPTQPYQANSDTTKYYRIFIYIIEIMHIIEEIKERDKALADFIIERIDVTDVPAIPFDNFIEGIKLIPGNDEVAGIVKIKDNTIRFEAIKSYLKRIDIESIAKQASNGAYLRTFTLTEVFSMIVNYCNEQALQNIRTLTALKIREFCKKEGVDLTSVYEDSKLDTDTEDYDEYGSEDEDDEDEEGDSEPSDSSMIKKTGGEIGKGKPKDNAHTKLSTPILEALDQGSSEFKAGMYSYTVKDCIDTSSRFKASYDAIANSVELVNKNLTKQIKEIKVYNEGGKNPGQRTGKLDKKNVWKYKTTPNIFYNNTYKIKECDLAFGLILDVSGSMTGSGIKNGKITMIVLQETLKALGINYCTITHTTTRGTHTCDILRYQAFREDKTYSAQKNYALTNIAAESGNCDSAALYYMENAILRTRNKDKIVMMFSDGEPTECSDKELKEQVRDMESKGIKVIGIGIGFPEISHYYTDYANGKNLQDMLNIVTKILNEYVLEKAE